MSLAGIMTDMMIGIGDATAKIMTVGEVTVTTIADDATATTTRGDTTAVALTGLGAIMATDRTVTRCARMTAAGTLMQTTTVQFRGRNTIEKIIAQGRVRLKSTCGYTSIS